MTYDMEGREIWKEVSFSEKPQKDLEREVQEKHMRSTGNVRKCEGKETKTYKV